MPKPFILSSLVFRALMIILLTLLTRFSVSRVGNVQVHRSEELEAIESAGKGHQVWITIFVDGCFTQGRLNLRRLFGKESRQVDSRAHSTRKAANFECELMEFDPHQDLKKTDDRRMMFYISPQEAGRLTQHEKIDTLFQLSGKVEWGLQHWRSLKRCAV